MSKKKTEDRCRSCVQAEIDIERLEAENEQLLARLRHYEPEPGKCEHGVAEGDWCEPCNKAYKEAAIEAAKGGE